MQQEKITGYPSIDKPWMKYYSEKSISASLPEATLFEYLYENNKTARNNIALNYFGNRITFEKLFSLVEETARAFAAQGVKPGDIAPLMKKDTLPYEKSNSFYFYRINKGATKI